MYAIGRWLSKVSGYSLTTAETGTDQAIVELTFLEGPDEGHKIVAYLFLTDSALPYTMKKLRACGLPEDDLARGVEMLGTEVDVTLKEDSYNGKTTAKVAYIDPPRSREVVQSVADKWRAKIAQLPKEESQPDPFG